MKSQKRLMAEISLLYYKKGLTQQEIANSLNLTRQTVSKLLTNAVSEGIVEITVHNPESERKEIEADLKRNFQINAVIASVSKNNYELRELATIEKAIQYLLPILEKGNLQIAVSWGRSVQNLIKQFPSIITVGNTVFPLFGSTEHEQSYFLPNELAREFAIKLEARIKYAWFPYKPECEQDLQLFQRTSYYKDMQKQWSCFDIAIIGIGNNTAFRLLNPAFTESENTKQVVGDVATHFFSGNGELVEVNDHTLRISANYLKNRGGKIAIAYGNDKVDAIIGAIKAGFVDTLITDEYTARLILQNKNDD